jgi:hypothetical protein
MSIFTDTMVDAVRKYRSMLHKYLPQAQRVNQLHLLDLKNPRLYTNETMLYQVGYKIVAHLQELNQSKQGYYSYSGLGQFAEHLKTFLDKYKLDEENQRVMHASQAASRYLMQMTQIMALGSEETLLKNLTDMQMCHDKIVEGSNTDQLVLYKNALISLLKKDRGDKPACYFEKLDAFLQALNQTHQHDNQRAIG